MDYLPVSAREAMNTQIQLSNTAHQREVADLQAAGLNPVLSAHGNGASTPSIQNDSLSEISDYLGTINSALDLAKMSLGSGPSKADLETEFNAKEFGQMIKDAVANGHSPEFERLYGVIDSIPDKGNTFGIPNSVWKYILRDKAGSYEEFYGNASDKVSAARDYVNSQVQNAKDWFSFNGGFSRRVDHFSNVVSRFVNEVFGDGDKSSYTPYGRLGSHKRRS